MVIFHSVKGLIIFLMGSINFIRNQASYNLLQTMPESESTPKQLILGPLISSSGDFK
jgi:hypothetical protein